jgi:subtilisin
MPAPLRPPSMATPASAICHKGIVMPSSKTSVQRYLLLPPRGLQTTASTSSAHLSSMLHSIEPQHALPAALASKGMKVLDSVHENGIKLVEMSAEGLRRVREAAPGLRIVPEVFYRTARLPRVTITRRATVGTAQANAAVAAAQALRFVDSAGAAVAGAHVVAFTDFAQGVGAQGKTRADGRVMLKLGGSTRIQRLYVYPKHSVWPLLQSNVKLPRSTPIRLKTIDLAAVDALQHFAALAPTGDGKGVVVGIIDTGTGPHRDVPVAGGANTVTGENPADFSDNGAQHGSHVAGIVGARGALATGMRGLAPAATLRAYRVFGTGSDLASNFAIAKAIDRAVNDGCDLINMSLGGGPPDDCTSAAIADARVAGVVVICASGNDGAAVVSEPGADSRAIAVGAFGRKGLMPAGSISASQVGKLGTDPLNFMAAFSNHGSAIDLAGPGVGVVSTVPGDLWAVMDGTSMACPAVTGAVARLLSTRPALLAAARDQQRSDAILREVFKAAELLGFGAEYEGSGWPMK